MSQSQLGKDGAEVEGCLKHWQNMVMQMKYSENRTDRNSEWLESEGVGQVIRDEAETQE